MAPDLRWALVTALARAGRADEDAGRRGAGPRQHDLRPGAGGRGPRGAARPRETKAQAWNDAALSNDVSNETQRSIAYVFDGSEQEEVLAPYLERTSTVADTIWEDQGTQIASTMLEYMFPRALTSRATLDRVDAWLATSRRTRRAKRLRGRGAGRHRPRARRPGRRRLTRRQTKGRTRGVRPFVVRGLVRSAVPDLRAVRVLGELVHALGDPADEVAGRRTRSAWSAPPAATWRRRAPGASAGR